MKRVVLLDHAGGLEAVASGLGGLDGVELERGDSMPCGPGIVAVLVPPEIPVGPAELRRLPDLRIVAATSTGYDHLDLAAIAAAGAWATHCAGYCDQEVAEHAIASALDLLRGTTLLDRAVRAGAWDEKASPPRRVAGATLGIVGLGRIGREVAWRALGLGMRVLASDPAIREVTVEGVQMLPLRELLAQADVVTLHALLTPETTGLIGAHELALMRPDAFLVNCARAALVDHAALGAALRSGSLGGCALDVLPHEPPSPGEPALAWPRTLITPHSAWYSPETEPLPYRLAGEAVAAVLSGREPRDALARPGPG